MGILSDSSLRELIIPEEEFQDARKWFKEGKWESIKGRILIQPFDLKNLRVFSYDLCVGDEIFDIQTQRKIAVNETKETLMEPGDAFLVLTREYIGLPRELAASVKPRFYFVRQGIFQSMTKIDPTWYGKIAVAISNRSRRRFRLEKNLPFSTLVIHRLDKPCSRVLDPSSTPALGKESMEYFLRIGK